MTWTSLPEKGKYTDTKGRERERERERLKVKLKSWNEILALNLIIEVRTVLVTYLFVSYMNIGGEN